MYRILAFLIYFGNSYSHKSSIFLGQWFTRLQSGNDASHMKIELYFYRFIDHQNEFILEHLNSYNVTINDISSEDEFLFVLGKLLFENSSQTGFPKSTKLIGGVYQKKTSDIYMVFNLDDFLPKQINQQIENFTSQFNMTNESELFQLLTFIKSTSEEFNYDKHEKSITRKNIKDSKLKYSKENDKDNEYFRKQVIVDRLRLFAYEKFWQKIKNTSEEVYFPLVYLKVKNKKSMKMSFEIQNEIEGFFICERNDQIFTNFIELKAKQINMQLFIRKSKFLGFVFIIYSVLLWKIKPRILIELQYTSNLRYLFIVTYDLAIFIFLDMYFKDVKSIDDKLYKIFYILKMVRFLLFHSSLNQSFESLPNATNLEYYKALAILAIPLCSFIVILKKLKEKLSDFSMFLIFYLSICLVPQIVFNLFNRFRNLKTTFCLILLAYFRFLEVSYFFLYVKNDYRNIMIFVFVLISIQSVILIIQNLFRSVFFIGMKRKNNGYDYYRETHFQNTECVICFQEVKYDLHDYMITPCNHVFHEDCLEKWMAIKMVCPICRGNLPSQNSFPFFL